MVKEGYFSKKRNQNSFLVHLHRYSWLIIKHAIYHLILLMIYAQNMIHFWQDLILTIMPTITGDKMKIFSHSTPQHAIEDVKFSFAYSSQFIYFELSFCHKLYEL